MPESSEIPKSSYSCSLYEYVNPWRHHFVILINRPDWTSRSLCLVAISLFIISPLSPAFSQSSLGTSGRASRPIRAPSTPLSSSAFVVSSASTGFNLRDELNYASISDMIAAGWTQCGTPAFSYYNISKGVLTVVNDGFTSGVMCWGKIPQNIVNWEVSTNTSYSGGNQPSIELIVLAGIHTYRALALSGGYGVLELLRDDNEVFQVTYPLIMIGQWHLIKMQMENHVLTLYSEGMAVGTYAEPDVDTHLAQIQLAGAWLADDSYDNLVANQLDPNAPTFSLGISPTTQTILAGHGANFTISLVSINGFVNQTSVTVRTITNSHYPLTSVLSTSTLTPRPSVLVVSYLTLSTQNVLTAASFQIIVNASSGSLSNVVQAFLNVNVLPSDFDLAIVTGGSIAVIQHGDGSWPVQNLTLTLRSLWRFTGNVTITVSGMFQGPTAIPTPSSVLLSPNDIKNVTLGVTYLGPGFASGIFSLTIIATSGTIQHNSGITIDYVPSYFSVTGGPTSLTVAPGSPAEFTLNFTSYNNFIGPISVTSTITPPGPYAPALSYPPTIILSPNQTRFVKITVSTQSNTTRQNYQVSISAKSAWWNGEAYFQIVPVSHSYTPGVRPGTWASYDISISSIPGHTFSATLTVIKVAGSNVTYTIYLYEDQIFGNSTIGSNDVSIGTFSNPIVPLFLIASNLTIGDPLYPGQPRSLSIQSRAQQNLAGALRLSNQVKTYPNIYGTEISANWDLTTGILGSLDSTIFVNSTLVIVKYELTATNAWTQLALSISYSKPALVSFPVMFTSYVSSGTPPYVYSWSFGDGQISSQANPLHTYKRAGNYGVTLKVTDSHGITASQTIAINVSPLTLPSVVQPLAAAWLAIVPMLARWLTIVIPIYLFTVLALSLFLVRGQNRKRRFSWAE
jgi:PKD domain